MSRQVGSFARKEVKTVFLNVADDNTRTLVGAVEQRMEMLVIADLDGIR
jgi:hypothetical protein